MTQPPKTTAVHAGDKELLGIIFSLATFWLCGQTFLNLGQLVGDELQISAAMMNVIVSLAALVCGMSIVTWGAIGDRWGRIKTILLGNCMALLGALLLTFASGSVPVATTMLIFGRVLQGLSAGAVMPAALSLINTYWHGAARGRALSVFSMGTFGGMALASAFGGIVTGLFGWRMIFVIAAVFAILGTLLLAKVPESAPQAATGEKLDLLGTLLLALIMVTFQLLLTQGSKWGWSSPITLFLIAGCSLATIWFIYQELHAAAPLIDFQVFKNKRFTGAIVANFSVTASAGLITVSLWVLQGAGNMSVTTSGYLTLSYAITLLLCIRIGEKMMHKYGKRLPMSIGTALVFLSILILSLTHTMQNVYLVIAAIAFGIYGLGLALFATPATSAAMGALLPNQIGVGSGMFKMASSLGSAIGIAISSTVFTMLQTSGTSIVGAFINYSGRQSNIAVREAGTVALLILAVFAIAAFLVVWFTAEKKDEINKTERPSFDERS